MVTLRIQHAVPNYDGWLRAFEADPMDRRGSGVRSYTVQRGVSDTNFVMIDLEFDAVEQADDFLSRLRELWAGPGGAVTISPEACIVEPVVSASL